MASQLNIKDPETIRLAREQAARSGKSVTAVIRSALEQQSRDREAELAASWARVQEIAAEFRANMPPELKGKDARQIVNEFYDDEDADG